MTRFFLSIIVLVLFVALVAYNMQSDVIYWDYEITDYKL